MNKKTLLAKALNTTGMLTICRAFITPYNHVLPILAYHRVKPFQEDYLFDEQLISASPEDFLWQMKHIKRYYHPIKLTDLHHYFSGRYKWPKRPVIITFDDGFNDNYHYAYPILKEISVPATMFVSTNYIGTQRSYWFDRAVFLLKRLKQPFSINTKNGSHHLTLLPNQLNEKIQRQFFSILKSVSDDERQEILQQLELSANKISSEELLTDSLPMDWDNVREMVASGIIDIGSHTLNHLALNQLSRDQLIAELKDSKLKIERETGKNCEILAYPFGGEDITTPMVLSEVKNAGYRYAVMYQSKYTLRSNYKALQLERMHVERDISRDQFAAMLALPQVFV